jgi:hypothetical protein
MDDMSRYESERVNWSKWYHFCGMKKEERGGKKREERKSQEEQNHR